MSMEGDTVGSLVLAILGGFEENTVNSVTSVKLLTVSTIAS